MRSRDLRIVASDRVIGRVAIDADGMAQFDKAAQATFAVMREEIGDQRAAELLLDGGWSNGYLYLSEPSGPEDP